MPIYEYRCQDCGHELDALQKLNDAPLEQCPDCGEAKLKRLISAPAFRLKGAGWYETDFKSDKERRRNLADSSEVPAADKSTQNGSKDGKSAEGKSGEGKSSGKAETAAGGSSTSAGSGKSESKSESKGDSKSDSGKTKKSSGTEAA